MTFTDLKGRKKTLKKSTKYLIDWEKPTRSKFQDTTKSFLKDYWRGDYCLEEMPLVGTRMTFDFYNASKRIAIETSGKQHLEFVKHFHGNRLQFAEQIKRDLMKVEFCELNNIILVEIYPKDVLSEQFFLSQGVVL